MSATNLIGYMHLTTLGGEKHRINVRQSGKSIYLSDELGEFLVHPQNENSESCWVQEYRIQRNISIKNCEYISAQLENALNK